MSKKHKREGSAQKNLLIFKICRKYTKIGLLSVFLSPLSVFSADFLGDYPYKEIITDDFRRLREQIVDQTRAEIDSPWYAHHYLSTIGGYGDLAQDLLPPEEMCLSTNTAVQNKEIVLGKLSILIRRLNELQESGSPVGHSPCIALAKEFYERYKQALTTSENIQKLLEPKVQMAGDHLGVYRLTQKCALEICGIDQYCQGIVQEHEEGGHSRFIRLGDIRFKNTDHHFDAHRGRRAETDMLGGDYLPIIESSVYLFYTLLFGQGINPSCTVFLKGLILFNEKDYKKTNPPDYENYLVHKRNKDLSRYFDLEGRRASFSLDSRYCQASIHLSGKNFKKWLEDQSGALTEESFNIHFIGNLLTVPTDYKPENFMVVTVDGSNHLIAIDNDQAFETSIRRDGDNHFIFLKTILYFLEDLMDKPLSSVAYRRLFDLDIDRFLSIWQCHIERQEKWYNFLQAQSFIIPNPEDERFSAQKPRKQIPFLRLQLKTLQDLLRGQDGDNIPQKELLFVLDPLVAIGYQEINKQIETTQVHKKPIYAMDRLNSNTRPFLLESFNEEIMEQRDARGRSLRECISQWDEHQRNEARRTREERHQELHYLRNFDLLQMFYLDSWIGAEEQKFSFLVWLNRSSFLQLRENREQGFSFLRNCIQRKQIYGLHFLISHLQETSRVFSSLPLTNNDLKNILLFYRENKDNSYVRAILELFGDYSQELEFQFALENILPFHPDGLVNTSLHGKRELPIEAREQIFDESGAVIRSNGEMGRCNVAKVSQGNYKLHFKQEPPLPGFEAIIGDLSRRLGCETPYGDLMYIENKLFWVSQHIEGENLRTALHRNPHILRDVDEKSISLLILVNLLIMPEDSKPDDFILRKIPDMIPVRYKLVCVDNDRAFVPPLTKVYENRKWQYRPQAKSFLFTLDQMNGRIHPEVTQHLLKQKPHDVLNKWLDFSREINTVQQRLVVDPQALFTNGYLLGVLFIPNTLNQLYDRFISIKKSLATSITHLNVVNQVEPRLAVRYEKGFKPGISSFLERFNQVDRRFYTHPYQYLTPEELAPMLSLLRITEDHIPTAINIFRVREQLIDVEQSQHELSQRIEAGMGIRLRRDDSEKSETDNVVITISKAEASMQRRSKW